jgi:hypothetical protein
MQTMENAKEEQVSPPLSKINPELTFVQVNKLTGEQLISRSAGRQDHEKMYDDKHVSIFQRSTVKKVYCRRKKWPEKEILRRWKFSVRKIHCSQSFGFG